MKDYIAERPQDYIVIDKDTGEARNVTIIKDDDVVEEGTPLNKATLLSDATSMLLFGTDDDKTVDDALRQLAQAPAGYGYAILTFLHNGERVTNFNITGHEGDTVVPVGSDGVVTLYLPVGRYTITADALDLSELSFTFDVTSGERIQYDVPVVVTAENVKVIESGAYTISTATASFDLCVVGGGGGGGGFCSYTSAGYFYIRGAGRGGAGGFTVNKLGIIRSMVALDIVVGAGGASGSRSTSSTPATQAGNGGETSVVISSPDASSETIIALGGAGGISSTVDGKVTAGGSGGGTSDGTYYLYADTTKNRTISATNGSEDGADGQETTTRAFGEPNGELLASGGGGGTFRTLNEVAYGGVGAGDGAFRSGTSSYTGATSATPNTGSGGGGGTGAQDAGTYAHASKGADGVVIIRFKGVV